MKKENVQMIIIVSIVFIILIGRYLFNRTNSEYYKNYNRVITEPDSIQTLDDKF